MADHPSKLTEAVPQAIGAVVDRLQELEVVIGPQAAPVVAAVRATLVGAMAARDRGDTATALDDIGRAMDRLAALASELDPQEAEMMRLLAASFRRALLRGDTGRAKQDAAAMFARSGAVERKSR
jgi:hypothetical protein